MRQGHKNYNNYTIDQNFLISIEYIEMKFFEFEVKIFEEFKEKFKIKQN